MVRVMRVSAGLSLSVPEPRRVSWPRPALELVIAGDLVGVGRLVGVGIRCRWSLATVEGDGVGLFDSFSGAVVVDVVPGLRPICGGRWRARWGAGRAWWRWRLAVIPIFEDTGPVTGEGLLDIGLDLVGKGDRGLRKEGARGQKSGG